MNEGILAATLAIGINVAVWVGILARYRQIKRGVIESFEAQGELFLAGPSLRRLSFVKGWVTNNNYVAAALSPQRLLTVPPMGRPYNLTIEQVRQGVLLLAPRTGRWGYRLNLPDGRTYCLDLGTDESWCAALASVGVLQASNDPALR